MLKGGPARKSSLPRRLAQAWKHALYRLYERVDYKRYRAANDALAACDLRKQLAGVPVLEAVPERTKFTDRLDEDALQQIRSYRLNVLFRFGFGILRGGILGAARWGVWSFHHGDNRVVRGGPALFWEIFEGHPVSGTTLQILTEELDGGRVIYRGQAATHKSSLYRNRNANYWKAAEFALRRLRDLDRRGFGFIESLASYNEQEPYTRRLYRTPTNAQMLQFAARVLGRWLARRADAWRHGARQQWFLAVRPRSEERGFASGESYRLLRPPTDRFYADPCVVERAGRSFLFFEDFRYKENKGVISCIELDANGAAGEPVEVLRLPCHLSYPFVFELEGAHYMIPETQQKRTVELYRATDFPTGWVLETVLLTGIHAVDATLLARDGRFWLFVGISNGLYSNSEELGLFMAESLTGPWRPHPLSPVVCDVRCARPAGALFEEDGRLIRPAQDCSRAYGYATTFQEVVTLNEEMYEERALARLEPGWVARNRGSHTYTRSENFEAIDGKFRTRI